jgi:hypothetical protein
MGKERRRAERYPAKLFVELEPVAEMDDKKGRGVVIDVSRLGLALETESNLTLGATYDCHVEIPFALKAKVVRKYTSGLIKKYGLEIVGQGVLDKFILTRLLKTSKITKKI